MPSPFERRSARAGLRRSALCTLCVLGVALSAPAAAQQPPSDLRAVFAGGLVEDRNGDDVADYVPASILVPATPTEAELVAAANVAARLGYETSALDLGLLVRDDGRTFDVPVIAIGGAASAAAGALAPGQGAVLDIADDARFRAGGVRLTGYDASGLLAAASYFSGRYPNVWGMRGATYVDVAGRIARHLGANGADTAGITLDAIVVDGARPGVLRLAATIRAPDAASFAAAAAALRPVTERDTTVAADTTRRAEPDSARADADRRGLAVEDLHRIDITLAGPDSTTVVRVLPARPWETEQPAAQNGRTSADFTLSDLYTIRGLFRDTNSDLVPDRTEAYLSVDGADGGPGLVDVAARIGLETAGIRLPLAEIAGEEDRAPDGGLPIVFGVEHYQIERLRRNGLLHASDGEPGEGFIELVPRAFGAGSALVIGGGDARGVAAAADYVAGRMPYLWSYGKGQYTLADVETDVRRFVQGRLLQCHFRPGD